MVKCGDEDEVVADEEIGVAGGKLLKTPVAADEGVRHGKRDDFYRASGRGAEILKAFMIFGEGEVVGTVWVGFRDGNGCIRSHKTNHVVDMTTGVVPLDA